MCGLHDAGRAEVRTESGPIIGPVVSLFSSFSPVISFHLLPFTFHLHTIVSSHSCSVLQLLESLITYSHTHLSPLPTHPISPPLTMSSPSRSFAPGVYAPCVTPFKSNGDVDTDALKAQTVRLAKAGK